MEISIKSPAIIISLTIIAVIVFNIALFLWAKNRRPDNTPEILSSFIKSARDPWRDSNKELDELAKLVHKSDDVSADEDSTNSQTK